MTAFPSHGYRDAGSDTSAGRDAGAGPGHLPKPSAGPRPLPDRPGISLGSSELRGILRTVEDCERASTLPVFQRTALEGLARYLGYRHSAFFVGSSFERALQDRAPVGHGLGFEMAAALQEYHQRFEAFIEPDEPNAMGVRGLWTLEEFGPPGRPEIRRYLRRLLKARGLQAIILARLTTAHGVAGLISVSDPRPYAFGPRDQMVFGAVGRHLGNLLHFHLRSEPVPAVAAKLSARERDVVGLVAQGRSNREIAVTLCISVETVKHHVGHAMEATGSANRTQLAVAWQREIAGPAAPGPAGRSHPDDTV